MSMSLLSLVSFISLFIMVVICLLYIAIRLIRLAERKTDYQFDHFRQSIEKKIAELSYELTFNAERFKQVNHLLIDSQIAMNNKSISPISTATFLQDMGVNTDKKIDDDFVFVLMPFHPEYDEVYSTIKDTIDSMGLRCSRGDDIHITSNILQHILQELWRSRLVIADISGRNPNVYYELGIAHALGKPVLLLAQNTEDLPFDISALRILIYKSMERLQDGLRKWLTQTLARRESY